MQVTGLSLTVLMGFQGQWYEFEKAGVDLFTSATQVSIQSPTFPEQNTSKKTPKKLAKLIKTVQPTVRSFKTCKTVSFTVQKPCYIW